ncbi:MAG: MmcQ/YjbR family DNA-binding protein [Anaerolineaceae bacterium]|nr:MmcQ/YjbR family DNA-binding protein [Anaerolineaceae bacterium]
MEYQELCDYLMAKKGTTKDMPFDTDSLCFRVGNKIFAIMSWQDDPIAISLKADPVEAVILRQEYPGITPGYHLNKRHWNTIVIDKHIPDGEIRSMIDHSYELVFKGLRKDDQQHIRDL